MPPKNQRRFQRRVRGKQPAPDLRPRPSVSPILQAAGYLVVFAAAILIHLPTLRYEFLTSWDDPTYIVDNPWIRGFTHANLIHAFTKPYFANFLPLHLVSYMVDYSFWGLNPFGYHLQSVLLNGLNAALALLVVRQLFGSYLLAFLAALLFAVHPSHVEAVAWVSIRKDLLSTSFLLLSVHFYLRSIGGRALRLSPYIASIVSFTLGMLSKVSIVAMPLFLLLLDTLQPAGRRRPNWKAALANKIPYGLIGLVLVRINMMVQVKAQAAYAHDTLRYLMVKGHAVWNYLALLTAFPAGRPVYDTPEFTLAPLLVGVNLAGLLVLPAILWLAHRRQWRVLSLGAGWIFVLLLPAILFPLVTYMADRYLYAASLGICWLIAAAIVALSRRAGQMPARAMVIALLTAVPFVGFAYRTIEYNRVWKNSEAVWTYAIARSKDYRVHNNMAQVRMNQKRWAEAERLYKAASEIDNIVSYQGLAAVYYDTKRFPEAEKAIDRALEIAAKRGADPEDLAEIEYTRGAIFWVQSEPQKAIDSWEAALRANPRHEQARQWLKTARGEH